MAKWLAEAALTLSLSGCLLACASPGPQPISAPSAAPQNSQPALVTADTADVRVTNLGVPVDARVGQTIGLKPFRSGVSWQVSFSNEALQLITPLDRLPSPGDDGWVWKALAPGETNITFTSSAPCAQPPCAPNVQRITLTVNITAP